MRTTCTVAQAQAYFKARFGLGKTAYYEILSPRLQRRSLAPGNRRRWHGVVGRVLFADEVVSACDRLEEEARER